jgi:hypothetical protein
MNDGMRLFGRFELLQRNVDLLVKGAGVVTLQADYSQVFRDLKQHAIVIDPPWGGPNYSQVRGALDRLVKQQRHPAPRDDRLANMPIWSRIHDSHPVQAGLDPLSGYHCHGSQLTWTWRDAWQVPLIEELPMGQMTLTELCLAIRDAAVCSVLLVKLPFNFDVQSLVRERSAS